jgi:hypothetical protein
MECVFSRRLTVALDHDKPRQVCSYYGYTAKTANKSTFLGFIPPTSTKIAAYTPHYLSVCASIHSNDTFLPQCRSSTDGDGIFTAATDETTRLESDGSYIVHTSRRQQYFARHRPALEIRMFNLKQHACLRIGCNIIINGKALVPYSFFEIKQVRPGLRSGVAAERKSWTGRTHSRRCSPAHESFKFNRNAQENKRRRCTMH